MTYDEFTDSEILLEAYSYLNEVTPVKFDCGRLCGSACCGENAGPEGEEGMGMWLLPGEKELLEGEGGYTFKKNESETDCLICSGTCDRDFRPFACRIYPYYASLKQLPEGRIMIKIKPDPRSFISCPLVSPYAVRKYRPSAGFVKNAVRAVRLLLSRPTFRSELLEISSFLGEIEDMRQKFFDNNK